MLRFAPTHLQLIIGLLFTASKDLSLLNHRTWLKKLRDFSWEDHKWLCLPSNSSRFSLHVLLKSGVKGVDLQAPCLRDINVSLF